MPLNDLRDSVKSAAQQEPRPTSTFGALVQMIKLSILAGIVIAAMIIPATSVVGITTKKVSGDIMNLPLSLGTLNNPQTTNLVASNGERIAYFFQENRQDIPLEDISETMIDAILAIEDIRFYDHGALDLKGTMRAAFNNFTDGRTQGGSSITQQLAKLITLQSADTDEQRRAATEMTIARKVRELKLAMKLEERYTKDQILEHYLNIANFGDGAYGVNAAAYRFFSTSPSELSVKQAATIAGLVRNPTGYNPRKNPERAIQRRNLVLGVMAQQGMIAQEEAEKLSAEPLDLKLTQFPNGCVNSVASWSCEYIRQYLLADEDLGETEADREAFLERGGLTIKSNIDIRMQNAANEAVEQTVAPTDNAIAALALVEPGTGKVRGLAQSRPMGTDKGKGETFLNFTVPTAYGDAIGFPAGSTFKMFTTAAALDAGFSPTTSFRSPGRITMPRGTYFDCEGGGTDEWQPGNSTRGGYMNMVNGTRLSVNTYFAQLEAAVGLCETVQMAEKMGINVPFRNADGTPRPDNAQTPAFTLGPMNVSPLDMAAAYATPAAGGLYCEPLPVAEILDSNGNLIKKYEPQCSRALTEEVAAEVNDILKGVQQPGGYGYSQGSGLNVPSAAKTGTTQDSKAVWYAGYTPELSTVSMIAGVNDEGFPQTLVGATIRGRGVVYSATGAGLSSPMWKLAMGTIQDYLTPTPFAQPPRSSYWRQRAEAYAEENPEAHSVVEQTNRYHREGYREEPRRVAPAPTTEPPAEPEPAPEPEPDDEDDD